MSHDADEPSPLLRLLDAAEEAGELDVRQVAGALGIGTPALRAALARPDALDRRQREALGIALPLHAGRWRTMVGSGPPRDAAPADDAPPAAAAPQSVAEALERA
ncbi:hypothetical protein PYV61_06630, partial [Roseisolibacter sp. H3M3-2]